MRAGKNPVVERQIRREAITAGDITIAALADRWMAEVVRPKRKPRTIDDYERIIAQRIKPALGPYPGADADMGAGQRLPRRDGEDAAPRQLCHLGHCGRMLNFAERIGIRPPHSNPCKGVEFFRERKRERFLSEAEIGAAAEAIASAERERQDRPACRSGLAARPVHWRTQLARSPRSSGSISTGSASWSACRTARPTKPRTIHLSDAAIEVLKTLPRVGPFVIAGAKPGEAYKNLGRAWIDRPRVCRLAGRSPARSAAQLRQPCRRSRCHRCK